MSRKVSKVSSSRKTAGRKAKNKKAPRAESKKLSRASAPADKKEARAKEAKFQKTLQNLREKIDRADRKMIQALAKRRAIVEKIGRAKKNHGEPLRQKSRWNQLLRDRTRQATKLGVDRKLILAIFECIQKESISRQARAESKGRKK